MADEEPKAEPSTSKEKILAAAQEEFAVRGFEGARVDSIAQAAKANKAMIYYHFGSKEGLYRAAIQAHVMGVVAKVQTRVEEGATLEDILTAAAESYSRLLKQHSFVVPIMLRELANPESELVKTIAASIAESGLPQKILSRLEEGVRQGELRPVDMKQAWVSFIALNFGYFFMSPVLDRVLKIEDRDRFIEQRKSVLVDLFLHGVKTK